MELKENEILVLRTTDKEGKAYGGFKWPKSGMVEAPDWNGKPDCGGGLHGLPKGVGDGGLLDGDGVAQIVKVNIDDGYVEFEQKCKFRCGEVVFWGDLREAANIVKAQYPGEPVVFSTNTGGDDSTNTGGYGSTNTGGNRSTNTGGDDSTNTGGDDSTNTGGDDSTNTGGDDSTNTGGNRSTNTGGYGSTNTGGDDSTNTGGYGSTNTGGNRSTNTGGYGSTNTGGDDSTLIFKWWDGNRYRFTIGYVGEDGIEPNVAYKLDGDHKIVRAE